MQNKKVVILIFLGIIAAISIIYGLRTSAGRRASVSSSLTAESNVNYQSSTRIVPKKRRAVKSRYNTWGHNPFVSQASPIRQKADFNLSGIIWSASNPKAMINDLILKKGDTVQGSAVVEIKRDRVILNDGAENFELKLKQ